MKTAPYFKEIVNRGFQVSWENGFPGQGWKHAKSETVGTMEIDTKKHMVLFGADSWRKYSRQVSYPINLRYLTGIEDGQRWAVRMPSSVNSISDALDWIEPAEVRHAREAGKWVARQGDVYLVELKSGKNNLSALPDSHNFSVINRIRAFWHTQHKTVRIPAKVRAIKAIRQTQISSGGRRFAD